MRRALYVVALLLLVAYVAGFFLPRSFRAPSKSPYRQTIHKIQDCIDDWHPECAGLDFRPVNGIEKRKLIDNVLTPPKVVCEQGWKDWIVQRCTRVHWAVTNGR
jgi:hypothetical protein